MYSSIAVVLNVIEDLEILNVTPVDGITLVL